MTRILVTGANGYIGAHVVTALLRAGVTVLAADRSADAVSRYPKGVIPVEGDIFADPERLFERAGEVDTVLHLAWEKGFVHNDPVHIRRLPDHLRFFEAAIGAGVTHLVALGTMHEVGYHEGAIDESTPTNPRSLYGIAKDALRRSLGVVTDGKGVAVQWLRCYYIYGDDERGNSIFGKIAAAAQAGQKEFPFTSGKNRYDFIEVGELAEQIAAVSLQRDVTGIINCCTGEPVSLADEVEAYIARHGYDITLAYGAFPDRAYDSPGVWGDAGKIKQILAARP
ncbi:NAD-dependent epimerase/dehydratase family protein [Oerskovia sp. NPDC056781]|uniref:NAD-dependent epimerase/dehydratase family protein n=1 Tax=Oerskovia sp. NPDC056781 TaxID=3345942 RepID=UPI00366BD33E